MKYTKKNKLAWEDAFAHRKSGWGDSDYLRICKEQLPFFDINMRNQLEQLDLNGKAVAQFCCNNGRELLALTQLGISKGVGFDIAENILEQARQTAYKAEINNCEFVCCNALEIEERYHHSFDLVYFTVGALCWFQDLVPLMEKASACLKPEGHLLIEDIHPVLNMLPIPGEEPYDQDAHGQLAYSYFRTDPWVETKGMFYLSGNYPSPEFTSFSHTMAQIVNAVAQPGLRILRMEEYDRDVGLTDVYDGRGWPLSYLLLAKKQDSYNYK